MLPSLSVVHRRWDLGRGNTADRHRIRRGKVAENRRIEETCYSEGIGINSPLAWSTTGSAATDGGRPRCNKLRTGSNDRQPRNTSSTLPRTRSMRAGLALIRSDTGAQRRPVSLRQCFNVRWSQVR